MRAQELIMQDAGYVSASVAAEAIGANNVGTIHRMVKTGRLRGARAGSHWYVSITSLLRAHADAPPILKRIKALGVEAKPEAAPSAENEKNLVPSRRSNGAAKRKRRAS